MSDKDSLEDEDDVSEPLPECIIKAQELEQGKRYIAAAAAYREALQILEQHPERLAQAHYGLSRVLYYHALESAEWQKYKKEIVDSMRKSAELGFFNADWELGLRLSYMGEHEEAVLVLRQVINKREASKLNTDFSAAPLRVYLASSLFHLGRVSEALEVAHFICSQSWFHWNRQPYAGPSHVHSTTAQLAYEVMLAGFDKPDSDNYLKAAYEQLLNEVLAYRAELTGGKVERILPRGPIGAWGQSGITEEDEGDSDTARTTNSSGPLETLPTIYSRLEQLLRLIYNWGLDTKELTSIYDLIEHSNPVSHGHLVHALEMIVYRLLDKDKGEITALQATVDELKQQINELKANASSLRGERDAALYKAEALQGQAEAMLKRDYELAVRLAACEEKLRKRRGWSWQ